MDSEYGLRECSYAGPLNCAGPWPPHYEARWCLRGVGGAAAWTCRSVGRTFMWVGRSQLYRCDSQRGSVVAPLVAVDARGRVWWPG